MPSKVDDSVADRKCVTAWRAREDVVCEREWASAVRAAETPVMLGYERGG